MRGDGTRIDGRARRSLAMRTLDEARASCAVARACAADDGRGRGDHSAIHDSRMSPTNPCDADAPGDALRRSVQRPRTMFSLAANASACAHAKVSDTTRARHFAREPTRSRACRKGSTRRGTTSRWGFASDGVASDVSRS